MDDEDNAREERIGVQYFEPRTSLSAIRDMEVVPGKMPARWWAFQARLKRELQPQAITE